MFTEMRTAALLQKALHGPEVLPAKRALHMATIDGARALGLGNEIGSLEVGKRADVIVVKMDSLHSTPHQPDLASAITYSAQTSDVATVVIDGQLVMLEGKLLTVDEPNVVNEANREAELLMNRALLRDSVS